MMELKKNSILFIILGSVRLKQILKCKNNIFILQGHNKLIESDIYNITKNVYIKYFFLTFYSSKNPEI